MIFAIVIVFWMIFHQNGCTLTYWANDNTDWASSIATRVIIQVLTLNMIDGRDVSGVDLQRDQPVLDHRAFVAPRAISGAGSTTRASSHRPRSR